MPYHQCCWATEARLCLSLFVLLWSKLLAWILCIRCPVGSGLGKSKGFKWPVISMVAGNSLRKMVAGQYPAVQFTSTFSNSKLHFKTNLTAYSSSFETYPTPVSSLLHLFLPLLPVSELVHLTSSSLTCFSCIWLSAAPGYDEPPLMPASNFKGFLECQYHLGRFSPKIPLLQKESCDLEDTGSIFSVRNAGRHVV